jgi:integrase
MVGKLGVRKAELARLHDEQNPPLLLNAAWAAFLASPNRPDSGESTLRQYAFQWQAFADWMKKAHADKPAVRDASKEIAEDYASTLNHGRLSPSTYNKHLNLLSLVFRVVKHKARLTSNPWDDIQRKRIMPHSRRELTIDELKKVCQSATGQLKILLALGVYSGLRLGDCATLRWAEVDLARGIIRRIPNKTARRNPKPVLVPIHPVTRTMLEGIPKEARDEFVLPEIAALYNRRIDLVTDVVQNHFKVCGIKAHKPGTGKQGKRAVVEVGFHSLRHTFVSLCRASNAPLSVVESIVGHSSPAMTQHYTHTGELAAGQAVALLPFVVGEAIPVTPKFEPEAVLNEAKVLVKNMAANNWKQTKASLLSLLSSGHSSKKARPLTKLKAA